jgi:hypothetical protein
LPPVRPGPSFTGFTGYQGTTPVGVIAPVLRGGRRSRATRGPELGVLAGVEGGGTVSVSGYGSLS